MEKIQRANIKKLVPLAILFLVFLAGLMVYTKLAEEEFSKRVNFKVSKISVTPAERLRLFDSNNQELKLNSWTFYKRDNINVGDSIAKDIESDSITIWRLDENLRWTVNEVFYQD